MASVTVKQELYERILAEIKGTEFTLVDDYVNFVLAEVLGVAVEPPPDQDSKDIEESLKKLGYM